MLLALNALAHAHASRAAAPETSPTPGSASPASASGPLPSVVSTNLCADLLLLRLASPGQIRSVSYQAQDPAQSPVAEQASRYPANRGAVEELLYFTPDIALTYLGWSSQLHAERLDEQGIAVVPLSYPQDLEDALRMTRAIAKAIGREAIAEREIARARARIAALAEAPSGLVSSLSPALTDAPPAQVSSQHRPQGPTETSTQEAAYRTLYLRPNGGTAGSGTYVDAMLQLLGLRNLAAEQGIQGWGRMPLEQLIIDPPDLILLGYFDQSQPRSKSRFARHPLLADLLAEVPTIRMPSSSAWGCGGLELIDAAEHIAAQLERLEPASRPRPNR